MKKIKIILTIILFLVAGCSIDSKKQISSKECIGRGGEVINEKPFKTCGFTKKDLGRVNDLQCLCNCCK